MSAQPYIPRFSDPADIDEFVTKLEAFERGEIGPDAFRAFRLTRGVYGQRQTDVQMIRVKAPGGLLGRPQLDALAAVADEQSRGFGHVTTRQNVQLHFVKMSESAAAMRRLDEAGLTTREACGNSVRNVTGCERLATCSDAPFDVSPYLEAVVRYFLRHPLAATLPRKFKIAFSGCASDCAKAAIHDLGFVAKVQEGRPGFLVYAAGGLSTLPMSALVLHDFVPAEELGRVGEAVLRLFDRFGNRDNKHRARLKYVWKKLGEEGFRDAYAKLRAEVDAEALAELVLPESPTRAPAPPVEGDKIEGYLPWRAQSVVDQRQSGYAGVYIRLKLGDITSAQMRGLGPILERFGDGSAYLTIDQNILVPFVDKRSLPAIHAALAALGLAELGLHTAKDVTSCPGAETCNLAVTASRRLGAAISDRLDREDASQPGFADTVIKISGCPNSCGQHHIADLGFHGAARKEGGKAYPMYQLHLGGGVDARGARFGRQVVKIPARRVPDAVVVLLRLYASDRALDEMPASFFERVDPKRVTAALGELLAPVTAGEDADIGEEKGFALHSGEGECAA
ncbi:MAG: nitrite/sulfite reductase [Myxococcales bacterium]|nr:nitrite/sulfite reductase [Myxococcales bacterium]